MLVLSLNLSTPHYSFLIIMAKRPTLAVIDTTPKKSKQDQSPTPLSPGNIQSTSASATVHALIASVSPLKPSRYFDGEITDGDSVIRIVGFDKVQRQMLHTYCNQKTPISLKNCQIQRNKYHGKLEVVLKGNTKIEQSSIEFEIPDMRTIGSPLIPLCNLDEYEEYDKVTIRAKVIKVKEPQRIGTGKLKQDIVIADATGKCSLTLWEAYVNTLQLHKSYQLSRVTVKVFMGKHHLSIPFTGSTVEDISDIENLDSEDEEQYLSEVTIIGVQQLDTFYTCMNCKKHVEPTTDIGGTCSSCKTTQRLYNPKVSAKLFIKGKGDENPIPLRAHGDIVRNIANKQTNIKN